MFVNFFATSAPIVFLGILPKLAWGGVVLTVFYGQHFWHNVCTIQTLIFAIWKSEKRL